MQAMPWWRSLVRKQGIFILSTKLNYSDENFGKFFDALGGGSLEEIAEDDGCDEETSIMSKK